MLRNRIPVSMSGHPLPLWLRLEIRLVSCFVPFLNYLCSPQRAAQLLNPRRRRKPPRDSFPVDLVCYLGCLLKRTLFMRNQYCIRRSYLLYRYLRLYAAPAILNIGLRGDTREQGHCWVTVNGEVFYDDSEPDKEYSHLVAGTRDVVYWI